MAKPALRRDEVPSTGLFGEDGENDCLTSGSTGGRVRDLPQAATSMLTELVRARKGRPSATLPKTSCSRDRLPLRRSGSSAHPLARGCLKVALLTARNGRRCLRKARARRTSSSLVPANNRRREASRSSGPGSTKIFVASS